MAKMISKPTYPLADVQRLVNAGKCRVTGTAEMSARDELGLLRAQILVNVLRLKATDFYKSMQSDRVPELWQDVYRPTIATPLHQGGIVVYCKVQISKQGDAVVVSFKTL
jgi:hypothetical protein